MKKAAFFKVSLYNGKVMESYSIYLKDHAAVIAHLERAAKRGYTYGHISKYVDMGTCYLMDLEWGKEGFIDFDIDQEKKCIIFQSTGSICW